MTDQAGALTFTQSYDPYGVVTYTSGASQTEFGFTGEQYGDSTQLLYLRARYYNPANGRFQSRDTWSGDINNPLSLNRWMYVEGNPVNLVDPKGRSPHPLAANGYAEGFSNVAAGLLAVWSVTGSEVVYDFTTLESATFYFSGKKDELDYTDAPIGWCPTIVSFGSAPYYSFIGGFDNDGIERDYNGNTSSFQLGISAPIFLVASLGAGGVYFQSEPADPHFFQIPDIFGISFYFNEWTLGGFLEFPVAISGFSTRYTMQGISKKYSSKEEMIVDIRNGNNSPIGRRFPNSLARELAIQQLLFYRESMEQ